MRLQYLGTGGAEGFPGLFCDCPACNRARAAGGRNLKARSCSLLGEDTLLDISPDIWSAGTRFGLGLHRVRHLVVTHTHCDHLDAFSVCLRARDGASILPGRADADNVLHVYGSPAVWAVLQRALETQPHANPERLRFTPVQAGVPFAAGEREFVPIPANHKPGEDCYLYAVREGDAWLLYANDTGPLPEAGFALLEGLGAKFDILSMDVGRGTLPGDGHMGLADNLAMYRRLLAAGCMAEGHRVVLNHLCHGSGVTHDDLQALAAPHGFELAYDGLVVQV